MSPSTAAIFTPGMAASDHLMSPLGATTALAKPLPPASAATARAAAIPENALLCMCPSSCPACAAPGSETAAAEVHLVYHLVGRLVKDEFVIACAGMAPSRVGTADRILDIAERLVQLRGF